MKIRTSDELAERHDRGWAQCLVDANASYLEMGGDMLDPHAAAYIESIAGNLAIEREIVPSHWTGAFTCTSCDTMRMGPKNFDGMTVQNCPWCHASWAAADRAARRNLEVNNAIQHGGFPRSTQGEETDPEVLRKRAEWAGIFDEPAPSVGSNPDGMRPVLVGSLFGGK